MIKNKTKYLILIIFIVSMMLFGLTFIGIPFKISSDTTGILIQRQNYNTIENATAIEKGIIKYQGTLYKRIIKHDYFAGSIQLSDFNSIPDYYNKKYYLSLKDKIFRHTIISAIVEEYPRIIGSVFFSDEFENVLIEIDKNLGAEEIILTIVSDVNNVTDAQEIISNIYEDFYN